MDTDLKTRKLLKKLRSFDQLAIPDNVRGCLDTLVQIRTVRALLEAFTKDLAALKHPDNLHYEFLLGPAKTINLGIGKIFVIKAFQTYSQYQVLDSATFDRFQNWKDSFNNDVCKLSFKAACKAWPSKFIAYQAEEDSTQCLKIKDGMILDWLSRTKHTTYLINLAANLALMKTPGYIIEAAMYVHASIYFGGNIFFEKRFHDFKTPSPEMISGYRYLWPQVYVSWNYDGSNKNLAQPFEILHRAIKSLDQAGDQLASKFKISNYKFFSENFEIKFTREDSSEETDDNESDSSDDYSQIEFDIRKKVNISSPIPYQPLVNEDETENCKFFTTLNIKTDNKEENEKKINNKNEKETDKDETDRVAAQSYLLSEDIIDFGK